MKPAAHEQDSFGSALQLLLDQQRDAMRTILTLSDTKRQHDAASARAALDEIFHAAERCHSTYRAMLGEIIATQQNGAVSRDA
ncbi:hypothetical protein [Paraburkholderia azotifigens]|uniref:Uncharacterized protein n=1 Tax=Paraburkholderia azotifigens TaxID=2057004 RepID=A0A5C6V7C2_9BURK|nr:hypothetical protein [Paraburkholderia azotifigens]TXC80939.1 hypothetical protein FRZ40_42815 [Paraburkholderia azotifigens]